ncbi:tRNA lysidine(34) synthetase TilS [Candidatus Ishikawella capsulata]|nr:tRNA lysidine(34) synthetase TilS [Candidatus Ishikawaella capsulata]
MPLSHLDILSAIPYRSFVIAFSGGLDSTVLLHQMMLWQKNFIKIRALHVHHGLSYSANYWVKHCLNICNIWNIKCDILYIKIDQRDGGIEASSRKSRYQAIKNNLNKGEVLLTGHHLDDQCETFFLALKRGSGPTGLSAMSPHIMLGDVPLIRPMLSFSKTQLKLWAKNYQLQWIEDESNNNERYDRNFLRKNILPSLIQRWPYFLKTTSRSAALCREQEELLDELLAEELYKLIQPDKSLLFTPMLTMSMVKRNALLRRWLVKYGFIRPDRDQLIQIWKNIVLSRSDSQARFKMGNYEIRRYKNLIFFIPIRYSLQNCVLHWSNTKIPLKLPQNLGLLYCHSCNPEFRLPKSDENIYIRFQIKGKYGLLGRIGKRTIKEIWQEKNIPPWERPYIPMIYYNDILIGTPGLFTTNEGSAQGLTGWQIQWYKNFNFL